ncbi:MAG: thiamine phosphate synthase [Gammaproteobacteria bacterium]
MKSAWPGRGLYVITPDEPDDDLLCRNVEQCVRAGASILQYRDKHRKAESRSRMAFVLKEICHDTAVPFIVNDDPALARTCAADGVHLGNDELHRLPEALALKPSLFVGVSCYDSLDRARAAVAAGAHHVALGSVFGSSTKPGAPRCSLETLRTARRELAVPIVAIGGITPENGRAALDAGADFLAVISGVFAAPDIGDAVHQYAKLFA